MSVRCAGINKGGMQCELEAGHAGSCSLAVGGYPAAVDNVNHPVHYTSGKVECIDALEAATVNLKGIDAVCTAAAIKYLWRWQQKGGKEDLKKARWYINRLLGE